MPRSHKRKLGSRNYKNYTAQTLQNALEEVNNETLSLAKASEKYNIPIGTLSNKKNHKHEKTVGGPTALTAKDEDDLKTVLLTMAAWKAPLSLFEIRMLVKIMLDKCGKTCPKFKNNFPGDDWVRSYLNRHPDLTQRITANIKLSRAKVDQSVVNAYFDNLEASLQDVAPSNIWNFDETNFSDEPGKKKAVVKRGTKYPERAMNATKASISVMYCGNGIGELLPPYVVYRSEHLWERWCQGGPRGTRFNRSKSGWFDSFTFQDWFVSLFLPAAKKQAGTKVIIGDNLSSHLDKEIISICEKENIRFVFLPPNTTHLTQPLDVAFFRPLKINWRRILAEWKESTNEMSTLSKDQFPKLLKKLEGIIGCRQAQNLISGFRACGIIPFDRNVVLAKLPSQQSQEISNQVLNDSVLTLLERNNTPNPARRRKRVRVDVQPGRSVCTDDFNCSSSDEEQSTADLDSDEENNPAANSEENRDVPTTSSSLQLEKRCVSNLTGVFEIREEEIKSGQWLLVNFAPPNDRLKAYIGHIQSITNPTSSRNREFEATFVRSKSRRDCDKAMFVYPEEDDICEFHFDHVIGRVEPPKILRRGVLEFSVNSLEW